MVFRTYAKINEINFEVSTPSVGTNFKRLLHLLRPLDFHIREPARKNCIPISINEQELRISLFGFETNMVFRVWYMNCIGSF